MGASVVGRIGEKTWTDSVQVTEGKRGPGQTLGRFIAQNLRKNPGRETDLLRGADLPTWEDADSEIRANLLDREQLPDWDGADRRNGNDVPEWDEEIVTTVIT